MKFITSFYLLFVLLQSCNDNKNPYLLSTVEEDSTSFVKQQVEPATEENPGFSIAYKQTENGIKTIHVKLNNTVSFDAIFDTGCSGMLISLQEAMSLVKSGTLKPEDNLGEQKSFIANGELVENSVFRIHEVTLIDTKGEAHTVYDIPVTIVENPGADVLVGNVIIDQLAEYAYTVDLKQNIIVFQ